MAPKVTFVLSESPFWPKFPLSCFSIGAQRIMVSKGFHNNFHVHCPFLQEHFKTMLLNQSLDCIQVNLVPRVSSLLYLYSGIQEADRQSDWLFAILGRNSDLRWVNDLGMSKFSLKPYSLPIPTIICNLFPKFEE